MNVIEKMKDYEGYSDIPLRLALGVVFLVAGYGKLFGGNVEGLAGMLAGAGFPLAVALAWLVAIVEFGGALFVLAGFQTRTASALLAIVMLVALVFFKLPNGGIGAGMADIALLGAALSLMFTGAKAYAIDKN